MTGVLRSLFGVLGLVFSLMPFLALLSNWIPFKDGTEVGVAIGIVAFMSVFGLDQSIKFASRNA